MAEQPTREQMEIAQFEMARTDLIDIRALKRNESFNRYWMRRLRQKKDEALRALVHDEMSPEKRETTRQLHLAYLELEKIIDRDEGSLIAQIDAGNI